MNIYRVIFTSKLLGMTFDHYHVLKAKDYEEAYTKARAIANETYNKEVSKFHLQDVLLMSTVEEFLEQLDKEYIALS